MSIASVEAVLRAICFIEQHLLQPISLAQVAAASGYSLYHFCRVFNQATGCSPYDYLIRRRLTLAVEALQQGDRVTDVAFELQFATLEGFSRAFRRCHGVAPQALKSARGDSRQRLTLTSPLCQAYLEQMRRNQPLTPRLVESPALTMLVLAVDEEIACAQLVSAWAALEQAYQVEGTGGTGHVDRCFLSLDGTSGAGVAGLLLGHRTTGTASGLGWLTEKAIPLLRCARFWHRGSLCQLRWTRQYIYQTWLPRSGYQPAARYLFGTAVPAEDGTSGQTESWAVYLPLRDDQKRT